MRGHESPPGYRLQAEDTTYAIERMLVQAWQAMPASEKARRLVESCRALEQLALAGLRLRYPHAGDAQLRRRAATMRLGAELAQDVYGPDPLGDGI